MKGNNPGIPEPNGDGQVAYSRGICEPVEDCYVIYISILHRLNDTDDKLIVIPVGNTYCEEPLLALTTFQERYFHSEIIQ